MNLTSSEFSTIKGEYSEYSTEDEKSEYDDDKIKYSEENKKSIKESNLCPFVSNIIVSKLYEKKKIKLIYFEIILIIYLFSGIIMEFRIKFRRTSNKFNHEKSYTYRLFLFAYRNNL